MVYIEEQPEEQRNPPFCLHKLPAKIYSVFYNQFKIFVPIFHNYTVIQIELKIERLKNQTFCMKKT